MTQLVKLEYFYCFGRPLVGKGLSNWSTFCLVQKQIISDWELLNACCSGTHKFPVTGCWCLDIISDNSLCQTVWNDFVVLLKKLLVTGVKNGESIFSDHRMWAVCPGWAWHGSGGPLRLALFVWTADSNVASGSPGDWRGMWLKVSSGLIKRWPRASLLSPPSKKRTPSTLRLLLDMPDLTAPCCLKSTNWGKESF